jgi:hypothetical protein
VGETLATSTPCYFTSYGKKSTTSNGNSAWLNCENLVSSKVFITNPTKGSIILYEVMAFSQYNLIPKAKIYSL